MSIKALRRYEGMGLIYVVARSSANYRLFDESALWCVQMICNLRGLGFTVAEIRALAGIYLGQPSQPIGPHLAEQLRAVRARLDTRMQELQELRQRVDDFATRYAVELAGRDAADFRSEDPRFRGPRA